MKLWIADRNIKMKRNTLSALDKGNLDVGEKFRNDRGVSG